jgi:hypothetical protein
MDDLERVGAAYLSHLTEADLRALVHADEVPAATAQARLAALRRAPELLLDVLDRPAVSAGLLNLASAGSAERFTLISPFLVFAAAIHRIAADLQTSAYAPERTAPRLRVPVFDGPQLAAYLASAAHRLFLAELLASFSRSSGGVIVTRTSQGLRRRRWNDLDLGRLAMLLESLPEPERAPVWRRLGDLALFLSGVFPAAIERALTGRLDPARLARTTGLASPPVADLGPAELLEWFGAGWYRLAARHAGRYAISPAAAPASPAAAPASPAAAAPALPAAAAPAAPIPASPLAVGPDPASPNAASTVSATALRDNAEHFHQARRVLNAAADRYLFPVGVDWLTRPA